MGHVIHGIEERYAIYKQYGVLILPEYAAVKHFPDENSVLLRINDAFFEKLKYPEVYDDILEVCFADIDHPSFYDVMMTEDHAVEMVDFIEKHTDKKFVIHCQAGISRSSATACAWAYYHDEPEIESIIRNSPVFYPNAHVYRLLVTEIEKRKGGVPDGSGASA